MSVEKLKKALRKDKNLVEKLILQPAATLKQFHITGIEYDSWIRDAKTGKLKERINTIIGLTIT